MNEIHPFTSPLKSSPVGNNKRGHDRHDPESRASKKLIYDLEERVDAVSLRIGAMSLTTLSGPDPSNIENQEFFLCGEREKQVREQFGICEGQIREIKKVLKILNDEDLSVYCQSMIDRLFKSEDHESIMAELGMILFYLDSKNGLPTTACFVDHRARLMQEEVDSYIQNHQEMGMDSLFPTGKTHYILRALAHMVFTSTQVYNRGGLYAILELLTNPHYQISMYLQPEHRVHILNVVNRILSNSDFDQLFAKDLKVHDAFEDFIRMDLKYPPKAQIRSVDVFYACMMFLFADIRQINSPNCYAVSSLIYATENHTFITLHNLINGICDPGKMGVLLRKVVENRLANCDDLDRLVSARATQESVLVKYWNKIFNFKPVSFDKPLRLGELLHSTLKSNRQIHNKSFSEMLLSTFKCPALVTLQLAKMEIEYTNLDEEGFDKRRIIEGFMNALEQSLPINAISANFRLQFIKNLGCRISLVNCNEKVVRVQNGTLYVGEKRLDNFKGNLMKFDPLFKNSLRVFCNAKMSILWSISDLNEVLKDVFKKTEGEMSIHGNSFRNLSRDVIRAIGSKQFRVSLTQFAANQIGKCGITAGDLNTTDLLIFDQYGGEEVTSLQITYGIDTEKVRFNDCNTPYHFLEKLLGWMGTTNIHRMRTLPKLLITTENHAWTLTPSCWKLLLDHYRDFEGFINETVVHPATRRFKSIVPQEVFDNVIERYTSNISERLSLKNCCRKKGLTFLEFREKLFDRISLRNRAKIEEIFEEEFSRVRLSQDEMQHTLQLLRIEHDPRIIPQLFASIQDCRDQPFVLAKKLRLALIKEGLCIVDPYQLELQISHVKDLPLTICMGDSNWINQNTEDPQHVYIVMRRRKFYIRKGDKEYLQPDEKYRHFEITYPKG